MHSPALHQLVVPDALGGGGLGMKKMWLAIRVLPLHIWGILGMSHILSTLLFLQKKRAKSPQMRQSFLSIQLQRAQGKHAANVGSLLGDTSHAQ